MLLCYLLVIRNVKREAAILNLYGRNPLGDFLLGFYVFSAGFCDCIGEERLNNDLIRCVRVCVCVFTFVCVHVKVSVLFIQSLNS